jgi:hypothetical protein
MIAAIISVLIGIFPGFMMQFVDRVTPDRVAVSMPQYNPAGAPPFVPAAGGHGEKKVENGAPAPGNSEPPAGH